MLVNDTIIRDNLTNKSHMRRCSLITTDRSYNNNNLENDQQENDLKKVNSKRLYIRSLSLANNESTLPVFRFRNSVLKKIKDEETKNE